MSRELDAKLAEGLGYKTFKGAVYALANPSGRVLGIDFDSEKEVWKHSPRFSEEPAAMLELIGEMERRGHRIKIVISYGLYTAKIRKLGADTDHEEVADTLPPAVALAAHKVLFGTDWSESSYV